jgi:hypothetical protein
MFIGRRRDIMQWSVSLNGWTEEYFHIMRGDILSMVKTSGKNYLFVSDFDGY